MAVQLLIPYEHKIFTIDEKFDLVTPDMYYYYNMDGGFPFLQGDIGRLTFQGHNRLMSVKSPRKFKHSLLIGFGHKSTVGYNGLVKTWDKPSAVKILYESDIAMLFAFRMPTKNTILVEMDLEKELYETYEFEDQGMLMYKKGCLIGKHPHKCHVTFGFAGMDESRIENPEVAALECDIRRNKVILKALDKKASKLGVTSSDL